MQGVKYISAGILEKWEVWTQGQRLGMGAWKELPARTRTFISSYRTPVPSDGYSKESISKVVKFPEQVRPMEQGVRRGQGKSLNTSC